MRLSFERYAGIGREFFWIACGQALSLSGAFVGIRLLTNVLPPVVYGELALGMTAAMLANQVILGPLSIASLRFFATARETGEFNYYLTALYRHLLRASGLMGGITLSICLGLLLFSRIQWIWLCLTIFGLGLGSGYNAVLDGMQNAARQRAVVAWHQAIGSWLRFLAAVLLVVWLGASGTNAILGYVLASAVVLVSQFWFFKKNLLQFSLTAPAAKQKSLSWNSRIRDYSMPFAFWGVFTWALMASERWSLQWFCSTREVGLYAVLYQIGYTPIAILTGVLVQLAAPVFFERAGDATDESRIRQVYKLNLRLAFAASVAALAAVAAVEAFHAPLFSLLVAPEYRSISWLLPGMVLAGGLFAIAQFITISLLSGVESRSLLLPKIITAIIGIFLNFILAARFGVAGVVGANLIFSAVYLIWIFQIVRVRFKSPPVADGKREG